MTNEFQYPIDLIEQVINTYGEQTVFEFSVYKYGPFTGADCRRLIQVNGSELTGTYIEQLEEELPSGFDLAINSRVTVNGNKSYHLPLIDFKGRLDPEKVAIIKRDLDAVYTRNLYLFDSGKSFHGYIPALISTEEWVKFMGSLLLLNYKHQEPISDARWIGHRLKGGYGCLRWSCVSSHYQAKPNGVGWLANCEGYEYPTPEYPSTNNARSQFPLRKIAQR